MSKRLGQHSQPGDQTWNTFIENHKDALEGIDLFVAPHVDFKLPYGIAVRHLKPLEQFWTNVTLHSAAE